MFVYVGAYTEPPSGAAEGIAVFGFAADTGRFVPYRRPHYRPFRRGSDPGHPTATGAMTQTPSPIVILFAWTDEGG